MKARTLLSAFLLVATILPASASAAGFSYGAIFIAPGSNQGLLTYHALDTRQSEVCDLATLICDPNATSTAPAVTGEIGSGGYTLSPSGKLALVGEFDVAGNLVNKVYKIVDRALTAPIILPVAGTIRSILFTPSESR